MSGETKVEPAILGDATSRILANGAHLESLGTDLQQTLTSAVASGAIEGATEADLERVANALLQNGEQQMSVGRQLEQFGTEYGDKMVASDRAQASAMNV